MQQLNYLIILFFVIDIVFTYLNVNNYRKLFPKKDYTKMELNPIVKGLWKKFGLVSGGMIATTIQMVVLYFILFYLPKDMLLILIGAWFVIILIHFDNFNLIKEKKNKNKPKVKSNWRKYAVIIILILGVCDLLLTFYYVNTYHAWQPLKSYAMMELNPLLLFLWNNLGLTLGMIVGGIIILSLQYYVVKKLYWLIGVVLILALIFAIWNHFNNITLLHKLMEAYPSG